MTMARWFIHSWRHCVRLAAFAILAAVASTAFAADFSVRPMTLRANPAPNESLVLPLQVLNTAIDQAQQVSLQLVPLTESPQGSWTIAVDRTDTPSSLPWTTLSATSVDVGPQQAADVSVTIRPPASARGYYFAGIIAESITPDNPGGVAVQIRYLVPVVVRVRGRPIISRTGLSDVIMTYRDGDPDSATTTAEMEITNSGQAISRVRGELTIERQTANQWRTVTRVPVAERSIIPGVTLTLGSDLKRRLPSGPYRLQGKLFVDGRRVAPLSKVIDFQGDPGAQVAYDATLRLKPGTIDVDIVPRATRTTILSIENTNPDPVRISMAVRTPGSLAGVKRDELSGDALSAEPWTRIQPHAFTLSGGGRQNVRVVTSVPKSGVEHANYYADLVLQGTYPDGQSAGETISTIRLRNATMKPDPGAVIDGVSIVEGDHADTFLRMKIINTGDTDFMPAASASVVSADGLVLANADLSGEPEPLLPLGERNLSGKLDISRLEAGTYGLAANVRVGTGKSVTRTFVLSVTSEDVTGADGRTHTISSATLRETDTNDIRDNAGDRSEAATSLAGPASAE